MPSWKIIVAWICFLLAAASAVFGVALAIGLINEYGQHGGAVNLALQAAVIPAPVAIVFGITGYLLFRSARRHKSRPPSHDNAA